LYVPPGGFTDPDPVPFVDTLSEYCFSVKVAVTLLAASIVTLQAPLPVQAPDQPANCELAAGVAVSATTMPCAYVPFTGVGLAATDPEPVPFVDRLSEYRFSVKVAVTLLAAFIVTLQAPLPVQAPDQPLKSEVAAGVAVRFTTAPFVNEAEHVAPQEMPPGLLVTVPLPAPAFDTVRVEPFETPVPVTSRDSESPSALKLTLVLAVAVLVGVYLTVTVAVAKGPTSVKGLPDTMLKGAPTDAVPVMVPERVLLTVKVWVAELPIVTLPKFTVPVGVASIGSCAVFVATGEHGPSLPPVSTAATATL
jgi:hypothetical protein